MKKQAFKETLVEFMTGAFAILCLVLVVLIPYFLLHEIPRFIKETDRIPISVKEDYLEAYMSTLFIIFLLVLLLISFYARYREHLDKIYEEERRNTDKVDSEYEDPLKEL